MSNLRKYVAYARVQFIALKEYAFNFLGGLLMVPIDMGMTVLIWGAIYSFIGQVGSFSLADMLAYQLLVRALIVAFLSVGTVNYQVWDDIHQGNLSLFLSRPINYQAAKLASEVGKSVVPLVSRMALFLVACVILKLYIPAQAGIWLFFLLSVALGFVIMFLVQFIIGAMTFWVERIFGVRDLVSTVNQLLSGQLIPVSVLPAFIQSLSSVLPFQFTLFVPISIYLGKVSGNGPLHLLAIQTAWLIGLLLLSALIWRQGVKRYEAQGG
ncbi:MAG: hypothetical protein GTN69_06980 [Armatimonadetes bacterium]|nr:hypothetical protein [Armatimonadota bacterium]